MKLTKSRLKQMIKEEIQKINEQFADPGDKDYRPMDDSPEYARTYIPAGDIAADSMSPVAAEEIIAAAAKFQKLVDRAERILKKSGMSRYEAGYKRAERPNGVDVLLDFYEATRRMNQAMRIAGQFAREISLEGGLGGLRGASRDLAFPAAGMNRDIRQWKALAEEVGIYFFSGENTALNQLRPMIKPMEQLMRRVERATREILKSK